MNPLETLIQFLVGIGQFVIGFLLGSIITGWFTVKWVIPKIMRSPDIVEAIALFREGKTYLRELLENQKQTQRGGETTPHEEEKEEETEGEEEGEGEEE